MKIRMNHGVDWVELANESEWSVKKLATRCGVSPRSLERYFLQTVAKTPKAWLTEQRKNRALKLLRDGFSIKEAALLLGYKHPTSFARKFKKWSGQCPNVWAANFAVKPSQSHDVA